MPLYDSTTAAMHTVLFGGISQYYFYEPDSAVYEDLNVPFTDNISCITRYADGSTKQVLLPVRFDALWGSNAVFIPAETVTRYPNEIIRLDASRRGITGRLSLRRHRTGSFPTSPPVLPATNCTRSG